MASIAGRTNGKRTIAEVTDLLAEGRVHDVGAAARFDWTRRSVPWHKSDDRLGRRRSIEVVTEGLEASLQALTSFAVGRSVRDYGVPVQISDGDGR